MCGILGAIHPGCGIETDAFLDGLESLRHRGPDGRGVLLARLRDGWLRPVYDPASGSLRTFEREDPDVMLGHARLSIIDLSSVASQPMSNERGDVWVVFNGEIYNHAELRRNLVALGHRFRTDHSDTEVLVHGYEEWGETLVERLRGMFAFATLSLRDRTLFLARDRFGEKPLYLAMGFRGVWFASELKALLAGGFVEREISPQALGDYLVHGFIPAPRSIFKGVIKLAAAQCVTIDIEHPDNYRPRTYWRPSTYLDTAIPAEQAIEEFNHELNRSILMRMQSDVPLGAFLSGGLDSTTVVKHMASAGGPVNTFTIGFRDAKYDEARYARMAANCYRTRHLVQILQPDDMLRVLPIIERHYDEPFADSSAIPTYLVSRIGARPSRSRCRAMAATSCSAAITITEFSIEWRGFWVVCRFRPSTCSQSGLGGCIQRPHGGMDSSTCWVRATTRDIRGIGRTTYSSATYTSTDRSESVTLSAASGTRLGGPGWSEWPPWIAGSTCPRI